MPVCTLSFPDLEISAELQSLEIWGLDQTLWTVLATSHFLWLLCLSRFLCTFNSQVYLSLPLPNSSSLCFPEYHPLLCHWLCDKLISGHQVPLSLKPVS